MTPQDARLGFGSDVRVMAPAIADSVPVRTVFNGFPAAVGALCAQVDAAAVGIVATSLAVGVSYDPPMVLFSVRNNSTTWPTLCRARRIGISVLAEHQSATCRQIASAKGDERFNGVDLLPTTEGALFIGGAVTWMDCSIVGDLPAGDHTVITFLVHQVGHTSDGHPLLFHNGRFPRIHHEEMA